MWLECIGAVSGWCCKEVYKFPHNITYPYSTCISSFFAAASLLCLFLKCFFILLLWKRVKPERTRVMPSLKQKSKIDYVITDTQILE